MSGDVSADHGVRYPAINGRANIAARGSVVNDAGCGTEKNVVVHAVAGKRYECASSPRRIFDRRDAATWGVVNDVEGECVIVGTVVSRHVILVCGVLCCGVYGACGLRRRRALQVESAVSLGGVFCWGRRRFGGIRAIRGRFCAREGASW